VFFFRWFCGAVFYGWVWVGLGWLGGPGVISLAIGQKKTRKLVGCGLWVGVVGWLTIYSLQNRLINLSII